MVKPVTNLLKKFQKTIKGFDSPRQLAAGVSLGMMIGMMPLDSAFFYCLIVILLLSTANLLTAACSAVLFHYLSSLLTGFLHSVGQWVLTFDPLESCWAWLIQIPLIPWTRFDNTVVMGSVVFSLIAFYPVLQMANVFFTTHGSRLMASIHNIRLIRMLIGPPQSNLTQG